MLGLCGFEDSWPWDRAPVRRSSSTPSGFRSESRLVLIKSHVEVLPVLDCPVKAVTRAKIQLGCIYTQAVMTPSNMYTGTLAVAKSICTWDLHWSYLSTGASMHLHKGYSGSMSLHPFISTLIRRWIFTAPPSTPLRLPLPMCSGNGWAHRGTRSLIH